MELLSIHPTEETPEIQFNAGKGELLIQGRSIPENATEFYFPIINWIRKYCESPADNTVLTVAMDYLNSISQKMVLDILEQLAELPSATVVWKYEDDDEEMLEEGKIFETKVDLPFTFIPVPVQ